MRCTRQGASVTVVAPAPNPPTRLRLQAGQWGLLVALVALIVGMGACLLDINRIQSARITSPSDSGAVHSALANAVHDSLAVATSMDRYLARQAPLAEVQQARAQLAQGIASAAGKSRAFGVPAYNTALADFDTLVSQLPEGILESAAQSNWVLRARSVVDTLTWASQDIQEADTALFIQQSIDLNNKNAEVAAAVQRGLLLLVLALCIGLLLLVWVLTDLRRNIARARQLLNDERGELGLVRQALERAQILERGQTRILKQIATGAALSELQHAIATLASDSTGGMPFRIVSGARIVTPRSSALADVTKAPLKQWPFGFDIADLDAEPDGFLQLLGPLGPAAHIDDHTLAVGNLCAELASLAADRHRAAQRLAHQATHDPLTRLANRTLLLSRIQDALSPSGPRSRTIALLFCDLNRFKVVNDSLGHLAGDRLLIEVGRRLVAAARGTDTIARLGGDEFVALAPSLNSPDDAHILAARISAAISEPFIIDGRECFVGVSIGITFADRPDVTPESLIREADVAMYRAKRSAGSHVNVYDSTLEAEVTTLLNLDIGVRQAVERGELRIALQPIVSMDDSVLRGFEALVRWDRPGHGTVPPDSFLPMAESTGSIVEIGYWVLRESINTAATWRQLGIHPDLTISVNVSARQLLEPDFSDVVFDALASAGLPAQALIIELTEHALVQSPGSYTTLDTLRSHGVRIALDDFGTGYSSLTQLQTLPVDILKLDRSFVLPEDHTHSHRAITVAVVRLAQALSLDLVIEGVETEDERSRLLDLGASLGQGYLFGRPLTPQQAQALSGVNPMRSAVGV